MCIVYACWTAASAVYANSNDTNTSAGSAVVALIFVYYGFVSPSILRHPKPTHETSPLTFDLLQYNLMMPLAYCYICEVFPFIQRSKGVVVMQLFSRAGSAFNQFVNPIGLDSIQWRFYLVYVIWLGVETVVIFLLYPETKGPSLEEVAMVMDRDAKVETLERGVMGEKSVQAREVERVVA